MFDCNSHHHRAVASAWLLLLFPLAVVAGCTQEGTRPSTPALSVGSAPARTIPECQAPGQCGKALPCEGQPVRVSGRIDAVNIFDKTAHPHLPFQKFLIRQSTQPEALEIWVTNATDAAARDIFQRVRGAASMQSEVAVTGVAVGVDLPITGQCRRVFKIEITSADAIKGTEK